MIEKYLIELVWLCIGYLFANSINILLNSAVPTLMLFGIFVGLVVWRLSTHELFVGGFFQSRESLGFVVGAISWSLIEHLTQGEMFWVLFDSVIIWLNWKTWQGVWGKE